MARLPHRMLVRAHQRGQAAVRETFLLEIPQLGGRQAGQHACLGLRLDGHQFFNLRQKPGVDGGFLEHLSQRHPDAESIRHKQNAFRPGVADLVDDLIAISRRAPSALAQAIDAGFQPAQRFLEAFLESAADGHHLAYRFHLRRQMRVGSRKFFESKARDLGHHIVDAGFEAGRRGAPRDVVSQLVQRVAHGQLGGHFRNRETSGLGSQRRRTRHTRVHLDDHHAPVKRVDGELHVRATGVHADFAQDGDGGVAQQLVFLVGECLCRRHGDGVAGVDAHRVQVLDGADDDAVVLRVAHDLHLELFPADETFLNQQLLGRRQVQASAADLFHLLRVVGDAATRAAQREARADDHGKPRAAGQQGNLLLHHQRFLHRMCDAAARRAQTDGGHRVLELQTVFGFLDGALVGANHFHVVARQHAVFVQIQRAVQRGLPAHRGQDRVGALLGDDLFQHLPSDGLDVGRVRHLRIGHDGGRVAVDQHHSVALFTQSLASLCAGIVELASLADDDGPGPDDEDRLQVGALRHVSFSSTL